MPFFPILHGTLTRPVQAIADTTSAHSHPSARSPTIVTVPMWKTNTVDMPPGLRYEVLTYGPGCAIMVAILSKHGDGTRSITLSNYPPTAVEHLLEDLVQALRTTSHSAGNPEARHEVFLVTPSDWERGPEGTWILSENRQEVLDSIERTIQTHLPGVKPEVLPFPSSHRFGESRTFVLQIPPEPDYPIRYHGINRGVCRF